MKKLRTESEIVASWNGQIKNAVASICCITYNHESYIEDALNGFLAQETDFPFEIIIHDDASTDRTTDIVREYANRYPNIIKVICQQENQYTLIGFGFIDNLLKMCSGEYVAFCEGDDYWIDSGKLQQQVGVLGDGKLSGCATFSYLMKSGDLIKQGKPNGYDLNMFKFSFGHKVETRTNTLVLRSSALKDIDNAIIRLLKSGDNYLRYCALCHGPIRVIPRYTGVYRIHSGGVWTSLSMARAASIKLSDLAIFIRISRFPYNTGFAFQFIMLSIRHIMRKLFLLRNL